MGGELLGEASPAVGVLELVEELADPVSQLWGAAEVDGTLAAVVAIDELEIGAEPASAIGTPGGGDGALGGEALGVLEEKRLDPAESGKVLFILVSRVGFFRVGGGLARWGGRVLVTKSGFFRVRGSLARWGGRVLVTKSGFFRVRGGLARWGGRVLVSRIAPFRVGGPRVGAGRGRAPVRGENGGAGRGIGAGERWGSGRVVCGRGGVGRGAWQGGGRA